VTDLTTMETRIENEVDDAGIAAEITAAINTAIKFYERKRFYFNQKTFTFPTVAAQEYYALADAADIDTFLQVDTQYITASGVRYPINVTEFALIDAAQNGLVTGRPTNWASFAQKIRLYPIPTDAETITVAGHYRLATAVAPTDTNAWFTDGEELIRQRAKRILALDVTKEPQDALAAQVLEDAALEALLYETQLRRGRPLLQLDPALTHCAPSNIRTGA
jgi:hypothetical protein